MSSDESVPDWEGLLRRLRDGDATAPRELLGLAHARLQRLAARLLHDSFPALRNRHDVDSVVHEGCIRLLKAFGSGVSPATPEDFFRFAAFKVRQVLLDMANTSARIARHVQLPADSTDPAEPHQDTYDPAALAVWREFHDRVDALTEPERSVFGLRHYLGMSQREIAEVLEMPPRTVSRVWTSATERLADVLPGTSEA